MRWLLRGVLVLAAGGLGAANVTPALAQVETEWLLAVDPDRGQVVVVAPDGSSAPLGDDQSPLTDPGGVALHPDGGSVAVVDRGDGAGGGAVLVLAPGAPPIPVAGDLDAPRSVAWADEASLIVVEDGGSVLRVDVGGGDAEQLATLPGEPAGIVPFEGFGQSGMLVPTVDGPVVLVDPATGEFGTFTEPLDGAGHPSVDSALGLCVPELSSDTVRCFAFDGSPGSEFGPIADPVAVGSTDAGLVVAGADGLVLVDGGTGQISPLAAAVDAPVAVISLGDDAGPWTAVLDDAAVVEPVPGTTVAAESPTSTEAPGTSLAVLPPTTEAAPPDEDAAPAEEAAPTTVATEPGATDDATTGAEESERATETDPAPADDGDGLPVWPILAIAAAILLGAAAVAVVFARRRTGPSTVVEEDGDPGVFHARRAHAAVAACEEQTFWSAFRSAEEHALWLQEAMRVARDAADRELFDRVSERLHTLVDEIAPTPAAMRDCLAARATAAAGRTAAAPLPHDRGGDTHIQVTASRVVYDVVQARLDDADVLVRRRLREIARARRAVERAADAPAVHRAAPLADGEHGEGDDVTGDDHDRPGGPTADQVALVATDDQLAARYQELNAEGIAVRREALASARRDYLRTLDSYFHSTPGRPQHAAARDALRAARRRFEAERSSARELVPPGRDGRRSMAERLRRALSDGTAPIGRIRIDDGSARLAELEDERDRLEELLALTARLRDRLAGVRRDAAVPSGNGGSPTTTTSADTSSGSARSSSAGSTGESSRASRASTARSAGASSGSSRASTTTSPAAAPAHSSAASPSESANRSSCSDRWTLHLYVDTTGPPHTAVGLSGPDLDIVFSMGGDRDTVGLHAPQGWKIGQSGVDEAPMALDAATNEWYREESDAQGQPIAEITVSLTESQFDECHRRLTAFARSRPTAEHAPVPTGDDPVRCPMVWLVVRSVFTPVTTYGTAWFQRSEPPPEHPASRRSVFDDALTVFAPRLLGRSPTDYGWDEAG